ncbi:hypothetical protein QZH41_011028 [Actinostola sp. cb2023]|nr:hypothetical protein QZH41_011028 [Actinostola sp. cb2023]
MAVVMEGPLSKWTNVVKGWQYRWFVLDDNTGLLSYYTSKEKMMRGARRGCLRLKGANLGIDDEDDSTFTISCDQKTFHFQGRYTRDAEERELWIRSLEDTIKRHSQVRNKVLNNQMNADTDAETSQRYSILRESTENMLSSVGHCLQLMYKIKTECEKSVLNESYDTGVQMNIVNDHYTVALQDNQKPNINRVDVSTEKRTIRPSKSDSSLSIPEKQSPPASISNDSPINRVLSKSSFELSSPTSEVKSLNFETATVSEVSASQATSSQVTYAIASPAVGDTVPYASYSSSDEEDVEFFDATTDISEQDIDKKEESSGYVAWVKDCMCNSERTSEVHFVYDYEREDRDVYGKEIGSEAIKQHGSVITHLLSQVRLGMDLTKVVLPTFILETRSLLEMYADFFSHPDLFAEIVDKKTPEERIVQVLKWFLSAMSAGRKGSVAKKPYNPIIGETFRCFWTLPEYAVTRDKTPVADGPVPWASKDDVTFLAEQVSHHPPSGWCPGGGWVVSWW